MCVFWLKVNKFHPMLGNPRQSWILDSTPWIADSSYWIPVFVSGSWFWIPILVGFRNPKPRISDSTSNDFLDSAIGIFFIHGAIYMILNQHHFLGVFKHLTIIFYLYFQFQFRIDVPLRKTADTAGQRLLDIFTTRKLASVNSSFMVDVMAMPIGSWHARNVRVPASVSTSNCFFGFTKKGNIEECRLICIALWPFVFFFVRFYQSFVGWGWDLTMQEPDEWLFSTTVLFSEFTQFFNKTAF